MEVLVSRQHCQIVVNAQTSEERVDGPHLYTFATTCIAKVGGSYVVVTIGNEEWQSIEALDDPPVRLGSRKPLKQFLENESRRVDRIPSIQGPPELFDLRLALVMASPPRERPDAGVDE